MSAPGTAASPSARDSRVERRFAALKAERRGGLVTFLTAGDPDPETSFEILCALPDAGVDMIELGMPCSDPMADGPAIQAASQRAIKAGMTLARTLDMVQRFRTHDVDTPVVLMGYYNPIYSYGVERFVADAREAGVDGLIMVDLPPEEDQELCQPALDAGLHWIRLATPTTDDKRLPAVLAQRGRLDVFTAGLHGALIVENAPLDGDGVSPQHPVDRVGDVGVDGEVAPALDLDERVEGGRGPSFEDGLLGAAPLGLLVAQGHRVDAADQVA